MCDEKREVRKYNNMQCTVKSVIIIYYYYYAICRIAPNFHAQILYDFRELHRNHEIFCHKNFLSAALSTRLDTLASRNDNKP